MFAKLKARINRMRRLTLLNAFGKLSDSLWLVARRFVF